MIVDVVLSPEERQARRQARAVRTAQLAARRSAQRYHRLRSGDLAIAPLKPLKLSKPRDRQAEAQVGWETRRVSTTEKRRAWLEAHAASGTDIVLLAGMTVPELRGEAARRCAEVTWEYHYRNQTPEWQNAQWRAYVPRWHRMMMMGWPWEHIAERALAPSMSYD